MGFSLATLFVDFSARGTDTVSGAFKALSAEHDAFVKRVQSAEGTINKMWIVAKSGAEAFTNAVGYAALGIAGFVTAGLQGTMQGERLALSFKLLSQEIAAIFLPIVEKLTDGIMAVTSWFRSLDESTQNVISSTAVWLVGIAAAIAIIPKAVSFIMTMVSAYQALAIAIAVATGLAGGWSKVIAGVAAGAVVYGALKLLSPSDDKTGRHRFVSPTGKGFEGVTDTYKRISLAAAKVDVDPSQKTLEGIASNTRATADGVERTTEAVRNIPRAQSAINDKSAVGAGNDTPQVSSPSTGYRARGYYSNSEAPSPSPSGKTPLVRNNTTPPRPPPQAWDVGDNRNWRLPGASGPIIGSDY